MRILSKKRIEIYRTKMDILLTCLVFGSKTKTYFFSSTQLFERIRNLVRREWFGLLGFGRAISFEDIEVSLNFQCIFPMLDALGWLVVIAHDFSIEVLD